MVTNRAYYSRTVIVLCMKLRSTMLINILVKIKKYLTLEIILLRQNIMIIQTNLLLVK